MKRRDFMLRLAVHIFDLKRTKTGRVMIRVFAVEGPLKATTVSQKFLYTIIPYQVYTLTYVYINIIRQNQFF